MSDFKAKVIQNFVRGCAPDPAGEFTTLLQIPQLE